MNQSILSAFGATGEERVINALNALKQGNGVLVLDDEDRENEGDLIFLQKPLPQNKWQTYSLWQRYRMFMHHR